MNEYADLLAGSLVTAGDDLAREFEVRLADSSALAVRVAYGVLRNKQDAEDVAQEAFIRAYRQFATLRDRDRFRAWLVRTTWRMALDWRRGSRRREAREQVVATLRPPIGNAETEALVSDRRTRLWTAIDALPDKLRIVVVLSAIEGQGARDVGRLLGVADGTVRSRLFEARRRLQELLRW